MGKRPRIFSFKSGASRVVTRLYGGFSNIVDDLKALTDSQQGLQVSQDDIPSICIVNDFGSNIEPPIIEAVLYGTLVQDETKNAKREYYRENNGRWSSGACPELNSVFILRFEPVTTRVQTLDAYLCPHPKYELVSSVFSEPRLVWRKLDEAEVRTETVD